ncbi:Aste57867_20640 [Aphanomyces stellatus]|uniref:Aste57867_20640 protein n=1 Tax=Aphanomyces stellatus TaxID=120398 RepID=A0A485LK51_9STRA|nr:hypothetical protein As57867_020572 [Aphanomyces stellatus]VFT97320.1 Aste57867_20640 [Aphanomyces stellatus]
MSAPFEFVVRKGKWIFPCIIRNDEDSVDAQANYDFIVQLMTNEITVTKRVSLGELHSIVSTSPTQIPEFRITHANGDAAATAFGQFRHYLAGKDRAGVATLTSEYWLIFVPDEDETLKCMIVKRSAPPSSSTSPEATATETPTQESPKEAVIQTPVDVSIKQEPDVAVPLRVVSDELSHDKPRTNDDETRDQSTLPESPRDDTMESESWDDLLYVLRAIAP